MTALAQRADHRDREEADCDFAKRGKEVVKVDRKPFRDAVVKAHNGSDATWHKATYDKLQALK